VLVNVVVTAV